jgi:hypothetical protein
VGSRYRRQKRSEKKRSEDGYSVRHVLTSVSVWLLVRSRTRLPQRNRVFGNVGVQDERNQHDGAPLAQNRARPAASSWTFSA